MNLHQVLAQNMARFGTKNLNEMHFKTLLNEGAAPGAAPEKAAIISSLDYNDASNGPEFTAFGALYKTLYFPQAGSGDKIALVALAHATTAQLQKNKKNKFTYDDVISQFIAQTVSQNEILTAIKAAIPGITYSKTLVDVYPAPGQPETKGLIATLGRIAQLDVAIVQKGVQLASTYNFLYQYLNAFNAGNVAGQDFTQYDLSNMLDPDNYVNLLGAAKYPTSFILYTQGDKVPNTANKDIQTTTKTVGGVAPVSKDYDVAFAQGSSVIAANDAEIAKAVQDAITMFPDGNISNLTILSSASPEYGAIKNVAGWEKNYTTTSGTTDPGAGTTDATNNMKLAYDRGVSFMNALNAGLAAAGKPQVQGYTVNWQIAGTGGPLKNGRFTQVQWEKAGTAPVTTTDTKAIDTGTTGATTSGKATFNYYKHVWSWGTPAAPK